MFDVNPDDISKLNDDLLRELVARLCEAEVSALGQSPLALTAGGHQNSTDGGIDVRVALPSSPQTICNLPRTHCGFQVKAEDMQPAAILKEMRPSRQLRVSIRKLAALSGAYIIVSSQGSVADTALKRRREAMAEAVVDCQEGGQLLLDFYDRTRLATWVREHPGLVLWVREKTGRAISGWRPHGDWAASYEPVNAPYLIDDKLRIQSLSLKQSTSAEEGISKLRELLARPRSAVRLVGLSGTGKTRLVQALFESKVGSVSLSPALAVYCNLSDDPTPQPIAMASNLIALGKRAVLIVDNCQPELHARLAAACREPASCISLITVEYDIREHQPEGTDVFELRSSSDALLKALLKRRFRHITDVNIETITNLSDGNARVAITLASTVRAGELLSELRDEDIFTKLFQQRQSYNPDLMKSAQACSLVYSFHGEDTSENEEAELWRLAKLFRIDVRDFYKDLAELSRRDLLQKRGVWRAMLPHAIANRLAALALQDIPFAELRRFGEELPPRLLRSFSRRLGYLHRSAEAIKLVSDWLAPGGLLGRIESLDNLLLQVLAHVAPVAPRATLKALQESADRERDQGRVLDGHEIRTLLRSLAFDRDFFHQAFLLLTKRISSEESICLSSYAKGELPAMFQLYLSGTHASIEQRVQAVEELLSSSDNRRREIGLACLAALLQTSYFFGQQKFDFGAQHRDYGFQPHSQQAIVEWYSSAFALCTRADTFSPEVSSGARKVVAERLRGLWTLGVLYDDIEQLCAVFAERRFWPEGWIAVRSLRKFRKDAVEAGEEDRLARMETRLQARTLQERFRILVIRGAGSVWLDHGDEDWQTRLARVEDLTKELGREGARLPVLLEELLPAVLHAEVGSGLEAFAQGLLQGGCLPLDLWARTTQAFATADPATRKVEFFAALLSATQQTASEEVEALLVNSFTYPDLRPAYPYLQSRVPISPAGMQRLEASLIHGYAPIESFRNISYSSLEQEQLTRLLPLIWVKPGGFIVALDFLQVRILRSERNDGTILSDITRSLGRKLLAEQRFNNSSTRVTQAQSIDQHAYAEIAKKCLCGSEGTETAREILRNIKCAMREDGFLSDYMSIAWIVGTMLLVQPVASLDYIFANRGNEQSIGMDYLLNGNHDSGLDAVAPEILIEWCGFEPELRYPWVATNLCFFSVSPDSDKREWKPVAKLLLERAPDRIAIAKLFLEQTRPWSWGGSFAFVYASNLSLFDNFTCKDDQALESFVQGEHKRLRLYVEQLRLEEEQEETRRNEKFE